MAKRKHDSSDNVQNDICPNCKLFLEYPVLLPCGVVLCDEHIFTGFVCVCGAEHSIPEERFPYLENSFSINNSYYDQLCAIENKIREFDPATILYDKKLELKNTIDLHYQTLQLEGHDGFEKQYEKSLKMVDELIKKNDKTIDLSWIKINTQKHCRDNYWKQLRDPNAKLAIIEQEIKNSIDFLTKQYDIMCNSTFPRQLIFKPLDAQKIKDEQVIGWVNQKQNLIMNQNNMTKVQQEAFDYFVLMTKGQQGRNAMALLGPGGTGKSFLIKKIVEYCINNNITYAVTATTGIASDLIDGNTLHSTLSLGINFQTDSEKDILNRAKYNIVWNRVDVLIIDEISMMGGQFFSKLNKISKIIRDNTMFFGGIKVIFSGDFLQLPPVKQSNNEPYIFETHDWADIMTKSNMFNFIESFRHKDDAVFGDLLRSIRIGVLTSKHLDLLMSRKIKGVDVTPKIYCTNVDVNKINKEKLDQLIAGGALEYLFKTEHESISLPSKQLTALNSKNDVLTLCVGARVMHMVNDPGKRLWNGSMGVIQSINKNNSDVSVTVLFDKSGESNIKMVTKEFYQVIDGRKHIVYKKFMPLKLCWASTVHKMQGATLDVGELNLSNVFINNQVYTGLSRFTGLDGLYLTGFDGSKVYSCKRCIDYYKKHGMI